MSTHGPGTSFMNRAHFVIVQDGGESWHRHAPAAGLDADGQLVPKEARQRVAHARQPQMLAEIRRYLHVVVVQRDDPVDVPLSGQIGHRMGDVWLHAEVGVGQHEELVDGLAGPGLMFELLGGHQDGMAALAFAFFDKEPALEIRGEAENGGRHVTILWLRERDV